MKESETYAILRPHLARLFAVDRVENAINPGMSDVLLSSEDRTIFVEMKATIGKILRGSQCAWCMKRNMRGCRADMYVLAYDGSKFYLFLMVDVVNNAGLVSLEVTHVVFTNPERVAEFLSGNYGDEGEEYVT